VGRAFFLLLGLAACAGGPDKGPVVLVSAAREDGAVRVQMRRTRPGTAGYLSEPTADAGTVVQLVHSPDHRTASFLWRDPRGEVRFRFPYGGFGRFAADGPADPGWVDYVFFEAEGLRVTARVPRGCPMRPFVDLRFALAPGRMPATVTLPDGRRATLEKEDDILRWDLPMNPEGVLAGGDHPWAVLGGGTEERFWITIDADGALAAPGGYLENW